MERVNPAPLPPLPRLQFTCNILHFYRNNICITREEIDENAPSTPKPDGDADADDAAGIEDIELEVPLGDIVDDDQVAEGENPSASRLKRELFYNSTLRISSCSDKGLAYVCETKYLPPLPDCLD